MERFRTLTFFVTGGVCHCWEANTSSVKAIMGSCVLVPCHTDSYSKVTWYKYKTIGYPIVYSSVTSEIMEEFRGRTSVPGSSDDGNCSLKVNNVRPEDSQVDLYVWIWSAKGDAKGFHDRTVKINVLTPESPHMSVNSEQTEGKSFSATCKCRHSCPSSPPQITWEGLIATSNELSHTIYGEGLWDTTATATFRVNRQDQGKVLSCRCVLNVSPLLSNEVTINVLLFQLPQPTGTFVTNAPSDVKIDYTGRRTVIEGNTISLRCTCKSKPDPSSYEWKVIPSNTSIRHEGNTAVLQDVRRDTSVTCIAINSVGRRGSWPLSLDVQYAPSEVRVDYTGSNAVVEGNKISLICTSESRPAPTQYEWSVNQNSNTTRHTERTVVLQDVKRDTSVFCMATNIIGSGESKMRLLNVEYAPSILPGSFCSTEKGTLQCVCQAEAQPNAVISWTVDGSGALSPDFRNTTQHNGSVTVSELSGLRGHKVTCTAQNSLGSAVSQIPVSSEGNSSVMVAAVAGAAVVLGVCIVFGFTLKKIRNMRHRTAPPVDLSLSREKTCHDYDIESDEDVYVNKRSFNDQQKNEDQDTDSCIYQNYDIKMTTGVAENFSSTHAVVTEDA